MEIIDQFIDIHTHNLETGNHISIVNILVDEKLTDLCIFQKVKSNNPKTYFSAGIHPWYMDNWRSQAEKMKEITLKFNTIAIGECGLDKKIKIPLAEQIELFQLHIALSEELQKPIIIHCVKSYNELINVRKDSKSKIPWIIHGFNGNLKIAYQCIKHGMIPSFGKSLFNANSNAIQAIKSLPLESFFLETDESNLSIEEIYRKCSEIKGLSTDTLKLEMARNFNNYFKC